MIKINNNWKKYANEMTERRKDPSLAIMSNFSVVTINRYKNTKTHLS